MDALDRYVDGEYLKDNEDWDEKRTPWKATQVAGMIERHQLRPGSICDIGCGPGGVLDELKILLPDDIRFVGYEPSPQAVRLAPEGRWDRIELVPGLSDGDDRRFDLLLCLDVVEHVEDYYGFLKSIRKKASLAIFHIPIDTTITTILRPGPIARSAKKVGHIQHFSPFIALQALEYSGYRVIDWSHTRPFLAQHPGSPREVLGMTARRLAARVSTPLAARILTGFPMIVLADTQCP